MLVFEVVRSRGLEPPLVAQLAPQASASTNSATTACGAGDACRTAPVLPTGPKAAPRQAGLNQVPDAVKGSNAKRGRSEPGIPAQRTSVTEATRCKLPFVRDLKFRYAAASVGLRTHFMRYAQLVI